jgi:type IV pilus assembly protein PilC
MFRTLQIIGLVLTVLLYVIGGFAALSIVILMVMAAGWYSIPAVLIITPAAFVFGAVIVFRVRQRRIVAMLQHLAACFRLNLPLAPTLEAAAHSESGRLSQRLGDLSQYLSHGETLSQALSQSVPELPRRDKAVIVAAEPISRLPQALERLLLCHRTVDQSETAMGGMVLAYATLMLVATGSMFTYVLIEIIPKFRKIFDDFGTQLPSITQEVIRVSAWLTGPMISDQANKNQIIPGVVWIGLGLLALFGGFLLLNLVAGANRSGLDLLRWSVPPLRGLERNRGLSDVCSTLCESLEAGLPLHQALAHVANMDINFCLRQRIKDWADQVNGGMPLAEAARAARLPPLVVGVLATGQAGGDLSSMFRFLSRHYDGQFSRVAAVLRGAAVPAIVLTMGTLVGTVVVSLFLPLINLIEHVAAQTWIRP